MQNLVAVISALGLLAILAACGQESNGTTCRPGQQRVALKKTLEDGTEETNYVCVGQLRPTPPVATTRPTITPPPPARTTTNPPPPSFPPGVMSPPKKK